jgi:hypothetical protein
MWMLKSCIGQVKVLEQQKIREDLIIEGIKLRELVIAETKTLNELRKQVKMERAKIRFVKGYGFCKANICDVKSNEKMTDLDRIAWSLRLITRGRSLSQTVLDLKLQRSMTHSVSANSFFA